MILSELLDDFSAQADEAYVDNEFDRGEVISEIISIGFESSNLIEYGNKVEDYINKNIVSFNSQSLSVWDDYLKKIYDAQED